MKKIYLILLIILVNHSIFAQQEIGLSAGYATNGYGIMVDYSIPVKEAGFLYFGLNSSFSKDRKSGFKIPYQSYTASASYHLKIYKDHYDRMNFSAGVGGILAYQNINSGEQLLDENSEIDAEGKTTYGVSISMKFDYKIRRSIKAFAIAMQNYHENSDIGSFSVYTGIGLRYIF